MPMCCGSDWRHRKQAQMGVLASICSRVWNSTRPLMMVRGSASPISTFSTYSLRVKLPVSVPEDSLQRLRLLLNMWGAAVAHTSDGWH